MGRIFEIWILPENPHKLNLSVFTSLWVQMELNKWSIKFEHCYYHRTPKLPLNFWSVSYISFGSPLMLWNSSHLVNMPTEKRSELICLILEWKSRPCKWHLPLLPLSDLIVNLLKHLSLLSEELPNLELLKQHCLFWSYWWCQIMLCCEKRCRECPPPPYFSLISSGVPLPPRVPHKVVLGIHFVTSLSRGFQWELMEPSQGTSLLRHTAYCFLHLCPQVGRCGQCTYWRWQGRKES